MTSLPYRFRAVPALAFLLALVPFVMSHHALPVPTFYQELVAFLLGTLLVAGVAWRHGLGAGPVLLTPLLLVAVVAVQVGAGMAPAQPDALGFSLFVGWAVLLAAALRRDQDVHADGATVTAVAYALMCGGVLNALAALLQVSVDGVPGVAYPRAGTGVLGNIAQTNMLASYLSVSAASAIHLHATRRLARTWLLPVLALLAFALIISASRAVVIYALIVIIATLVAARAQPSPQRSFGVAFFIVALLGWHLLYPWLTTVLPGLNDYSIFSRLRTEGVLGGQRKMQLAVAWSMFAAHPLLGAGIGSFDQWVFWRPLDGGTDLLNLTNIEHAHNIVAHLAAELGILAIVPLAAFAIAFWRNRPSDPGNTWWVWCGGSILIFHSLVEYPLWYVHFLGLFAYFAASVIPAGRWLARPSMMLRGVTGLALVAILAGSSAVVRDYYRLETYPGSRVSPAELGNAFLEITGNPLIGHYARAFLAANMNPAPVRISEKLALCERAIGEYADAAVIQGCLPIYWMAGRNDQATRLRERMMRDIPKQDPIAKQNARR